MISEQRFSCAGQTIRGKLFRASEAGGPTLLLLPGFPGNEDDVLELGELPEAIVSLISMMVMLHIEGAGDRVTICLH